MSEEKKLRGFAAMTPEQRKAMQEKSAATRLANKAKLSGQNLTNIGTIETFAEPAALIGPKAGITAKVTDLKDELDVKLEHFRYTKDPREALIWTANPDLSPLSVPKEIKTKYPDLEFAWKRGKKIQNDQLGAWEPFKDKQFGKSADGLVKRGGEDAILCAMPKDLYGKIEAGKRERARGALIGLDQSRQDEMRHRAGGDPEDGPLINESVVKGGRVGGTGLMVGRHNVRDRNEMLRERAIRESEAKQARRQYFDLGR